jgi:hypothetical protein
MAYFARPPNGRVFFCVTALKKIKVKIKDLELKNGWGWVR